ncbi:hypothetical protein PMAYCL1PPCAC_04259, partial [Pristionchus mayeri]
VSNTADWAESYLDLMFHEYGGDNESISFERYSRDTFADSASEKLKDSCLDDDPLPSDPDWFILNRLDSVGSQNVDVLIWLTAKAPTLSIPPSYNITRTIGVGLNGIILNSTFDDSITITDFSQSEVISCMIDRLWDDIDDPYLQLCEESATSPPNLSSRRLDIRPYRLTIV